MILKNPKISCKENISLVNWVWPCTSPWWSQVTEAASSLPHPAVCVFLTWAVSFNKVQLLLSLQKLFIFSFSPTLWYDLSSISGKWEASPSSVLFLSFFAGACADYAYEQQAQNILAQHTSILVTVTLLWYCYLCNVCKNGAVYKSFESQLKVVAVPVLTNFVAVGVCVSFGNIPIHFMMTVIV